MSAIGKSVGDGTPVTSAQPVYTVDISTGLPSSGGGGPSQVEVTNFPSSQSVTGPLTNAQLTAITGAVSAAAYTDDTGAASGTVIALLKGIYVQLAAINANTASPA